MFSDSDSWDEESTQKLVDIADDSLSEIFTEDGKKAVLFYLKANYNVSLKDIVSRPTELAKALEDLLGVLGSNIVRDRIMRRFNGPVAPRISGAHVQASDELASLLNGRYTSSGGLYSPS
jgi:hypothetical protein